MLESKAEAVAFTSSNFAVLDMTEKRYKNAY